MTGDDHGHDADGVHDPPGERDPAGEQEDEREDEQEHEREGQQDPADELMAGFRSSGGGTTARFGAGQAGIIRNLVRQVAELIADGPLDDAEPDGRPGSRGFPAAATVPEPGSAAALEAEFAFTEADSVPSDPALARLLPDAYRDDAEASAEFRRYTETHLRSAKVAAARTVLATLPARGGRIRLSDADSQAWLRALNDVRLALSARLGVTDDFDDMVSNMDRTDPRYAYVWVYQWLAYLQESLVDSLS